MEIRHIIFLGSSVTYGSAAGGVSFAEHMATRLGCQITKEAVSGTTLVEDSDDSYVSRLKRLDPGIPADLFVCQLSTNDASQHKPLGEVSSSAAPDSFDTHTVAGALEYIISYAKQTWGCPVAVYTNPRFESPEYERMEALLHRLAEKWDLILIDMWNDRAFWDITPEQRRLYMADAIHPTDLGYMEWWTPYMLRCLGQ